MTIAYTDLMNLAIVNLRLTLKIVVMVTVLMSVIDYVEQKYSDKIKSMITDKPLVQIVAASLLGAVPGCMDAFLIVSLYIHGLVGFGALTAVMLSTAGDEAFIMLVMAPEAALKIFAITIVFGIIGGFVADQIIKRFKIKTCEHCKIEVHEEETGLHFLKEHVYRHILKEHIPKLILWIFVPLTLVEFLIQNFDFASLMSSMPVLALIVFAALVGVIPESGPHMIFLVLYSKGLIPFSVLLVSTLSQDGHGLLPLLSYTVKDTFYVQMFTTGFSLIVGVVLHIIGV
ncbi:MAG: arsenic efflux protein [Candidatus Bathyarchaeota archaeon]|nr:arsenic efflux protein [Candidatus Bathyarchaeota archaeon]